MKRMKKLFILIGLLVIVFTFAYAQKTTYLSRYFHKTQVIKFGYPLKFADHLYLVTGGQGGLQAYEVIFKTR